MERDTVSINGRVMTGEQGPEGIIGALTRCILAQVKRAQMRYLVVVFVFLCVNGGELVRRRRKHESRSPFLRMPPQLISSGDLLESAPQKMYKQRWQE